MLEMPSYITEREIAWLECTLIAGIIARDQGYFDDSWRVFSESCKLFELDKGLKDEAK